MAPEEAFGPVVVASLACATTTTTTTKGKNALDSLVCLFGDQGGMAAVVFVAVVSDLAEVVAVTENDVEGKGNYEWIFDVTYDYKGERRTRSFGPYRTYGKAENATLYIGQIKDEKGNFPPQETINGAPQKCQQ